MKCLDCGLTMTHVGGDYYECPSCLIMLPMNEQPKNKPAIMPKYIDMFGDEDKGKNYPL